MTAPPFDRGLQPERSELAWRRTCLTFGITSIVALRLLPAVFDDARWVVVGVVGVLLSTVLWTLSRRRGRRTSEALRAQGLRARLTGGGLILAVSLGLSVVGAAGIAVVIAAASSRG
ncbi:DUF202 domain-containing protein [Microbacterium sp. TPD7012]|uniref:DUF202 domain-containing protein n=1 Tax=Microbacterium sp. TPD7012 TaxID=2171975 RepID=UPI000D518AF4|nr:DUF202 domain-containing protein [Microbacterium sp. TPD7012]PVE98628.1 DUF202 domain-containing protein [Microbacterium sp. TPD7012]